MSFKTLMRLLMMGYGMSDSLQKDLIPRPKENPKRPCLHCLKEHKHNNSYCSVECCKLSQKIEKDLRGSRKKLEERERILKHINSPCFDGTSHARSSL